MNSQQFQKQKVHTSRLGLLHNVALLSVVSLLTSCDNLDISQKERTISREVETLRVDAVAAYPIDPPISLGRSYETLCIVLDFDGKNVSEEDYQRELLEFLGNTAISVSMAAESGDSIELPSQGGAWKSAGIFGKHPEISVCFSPDGSRIEANKFEAAKVEISTTEEIDILGIYWFAADTFD